MTNPEGRKKVVIFMEAAIDEIKYTLESSKDKEVKDFYLRNAIRFLEEAISIQKGE